MHARTPFFSCADALWIARICFHSSYVYIYLFVKVIALDIIRSSLIDYDTRNDVPVLSSREWTCSRELSLRH